MVGNRWPAIAPCVDGDLVVKGAHTNSYRARVIEQSRRLLDTALFRRLPLDKKVGKPFRNSSCQEMPCTTKGRSPEGLVAAGLNRELKSPKKDLSP
jgi:hypothetical protein